MNQFVQKWSAGTQKDNSNTYASGPTQSSDEPYTKINTTLGSEQTGRGDISRTLLYNTAFPEDSGTKSGSHRHSLHQWYSQYSSIRKISKVC